MSKNTAPGNGTDVTRDMPPLAFRAAFRPGSCDPEKRTVEVVWTTGARVLRGFFDQWYEELSLDPKHVRMERLNNGAPLLDSHDMWSGTGAVLGVVESAKLEGDQGTAVVRFAKAGDAPESDRVFRLVQDGILQNISVGYRTYKLEKVKDPEAEIPTYRAVDWEPFEISVVAAGADDGAGFRSTEARALNPCVFVEQRQEKHMDPEKTPTSPAGTAGATAIPAPTEEATRAAEEATRAERERATTIRALVTKHKLGDEFANDLVGRGVSIEAARVAVLDKLAANTEATRTNGAHSTIQIGVEGREKFMRAATMGLLHRLGQVAMIAEAKKRAPAQLQHRFADFDLAEDGGEFRGMRPARLAQEFLERAGVGTRMLNDSDIVGRALTFSRAGGENTSSDYAVLLENIMYKVLLGNYLLAEDTWREFCGTTTVQDFRPSNRYRTGSFGTLPVVPEGAEFTYVSIPDGLKRTVSAQTYGRMLAVTRQALVNDDLGAILDTTSKFGRSVGLTIESSVYALLNANNGLGANYGNKPFFDGSNANINGAASALGVQGIDADRVVLASQKDISSNEFLNLARWGKLKLLVHVSQGGLARNVNKAEWDITQSNKFQVPNIVQGLFEKIVDSPRLASASRRYIFAEPGDAAAIMVAFLNGEQAPFMEEKLGWRVDGTEWKLRMDFGVQFLDPKGAVTNAGQ